MQVDHQPDTIGFTVVTLDEPDALTPGLHISGVSWVAWFGPADGLPRHDPLADARGVEGTDPQGYSSHGNAGVHITAQSSFSSQDWSWLFGAAPILVAAGSPFLNRIMVGIPRTP
jgi:hypothetical protein